MTRSVLPPLGDPSLHFWITHAVARRAGIRFTEALGRGVLSEQGFAGLVTACRQCQHVEVCVARLAQPDPNETPPNFCENHEILTRLAAQV